ncbi:MAG TPA: AraC family transcriptional regulator [Clostridiales bacterium]|nr:AraC family transcriptional regulator [Clostridiales bacterium]
MDMSALQATLYNLNEDELFYRKYYFARQQEYSLKNFIATLDMNYVKARNLLISELPETIPPEYEDEWYFDLNNSQSISILKHNCYSPAIPHHHTFFELIYVYDGKCNQSIGDSKIKMRTGDFCIIPPGVTHTIEVFDESVIIDILIRKNTLENIFFNFLRNDNILTMFFLNNIYSKNVNDYIIFHSGDDYHIRTAISYMLLEYINKDQYYYQMMSNTIMNVFGLLLRNYEKNVELPSIVKKSDVQRFALVRFIQDNHANVTLEDISKKFHFTPEYTSKLIKATTGYTFTHILQKIRMEKAKSLLLDTNLSVSSIGLQIGYETTEHFIRTFKKNQQMTPTEFRKSKDLF